MQTITENVKPVKIFFFFSLREGSFCNSGGAEDKYTRKQTTNKPENSREMRRSNFKSINICQIRRSEMSVDRIEIGPPRVNEKRKFLFFSSFFHVCDNEDVSIHSCKFQFDSCSPPFALLSLSSGYFAITSVWNLFRAAEFTITLSRTHCSNKSQWNRLEWSLNP